MPKKKHHLSIASWVLFVAGYLLFAGKLEISEFIAGIIAAAGAVFLFNFIYVRREPLLVPPKWLPLLLLLPKATIWETWLLLIVLIRWRRGYHSYGTFINYPYRIRAANPHAAALRAYITYGVCFSPNSYLIDFDPKQRVIIIRQLVGNKLSESDESFLELQ